ncbi:unnamed protein product [Effrenium voratum]|nr:unnamed protein product [Effrenium voratum]
MAVKSLIGSIIFTVACCGGFAFLENETRPEKQWVPAGSLALEHDEYVKATWPSNARFNFFSATCADVAEADCNILDPKYLQRFHELNARIMNITIDGTSLVADLDKDHKRSEGDNRPWTIYSGSWSFSGDPSSVNGSVVFNGRKCYAFGPFCGRSSVLDVFRGDDYVIQNLDSNQIMLALNNWEDQETFCPLTLATADSPCYNSTCKAYNTPQERYTCRVEATEYCNQKCPTNTMMVNGEEVTIPVNIATSRTVAASNWATWAPSAPRQRQLLVDSSTPTQDRRPRAPSSSSRPRSGPWWEDWCPTPTGSMRAASTLQAFGHWTRMRAVLPQRGPHRPSGG